MTHLRINKKKFFILRFLFLCLSIILLLKIVDLRLVMVYLINIPWHILIILITVGVIRAWFTGIRWYLLNPDISGQLSQWQYFRFIMMSKAFNLIMPGALGGDFFRTAITLDTVKNRKADNVIAIIVDRFIGLLSIVILGFFALLLVRDIPGRSDFFSYFATIYLIIFIILFSSTNYRMLNLVEKIICRLGNIGIFINNVLIKWKAALRFFRSNKINVFYAIIICLPIHIVSFFSAYILAQSLRIDISFLDICIIISLVWLITSIPITISGAGVRELSMIYFFSIYGVDAEPATALSIYIYILSLFLGLLGVLFIIDWAKLYYFIRLRLKG